MGSAREQAQLRKEEEAPASAEAYRERNGETLDRRNQLKAGWLGFPLGQKAGSQWPELRKHQAAIEAVEARTSLL